MEKEKPLLKIKIAAPGLKPGRIPVPLLLKICQDTQDVINKQADAIEGTKHELTLDLIGLKKGSTVLNFAQAQTQEQQIPLDFVISDSTLTIGSEAANGVAEMLKSASRKRGGWREDPALEVLDVLDDLGDTLNKAGVESFKWIVPSRGLGRSKTAIVSRQTLFKIKERKQQLDLARKSATHQQEKSGSAEMSESFLEGMLEVADGKCRIQPPLGAALTVSFGADQAAKVLEAVHKPVRVRIDQQSRKLVDRSLKDEHEMGSELFFDAKTLDQLIAEQGTKPIASLDALAGSIPDDDVDRFVAEIYAERLASQV